METLCYDDQDQDQDKDDDDDDAKLHSNGRKRANFPIQWASHPASQTTTTVDLTVNYDATAPSE